jgi:hypothetical protein
MYEKGDKALAMAMAASVALMMGLFLYDNTIDWRRMAPIWLAIMAAPVVLASDYSRFHQIEAAAATRRRRPQPTNHWHKQTSRNFRRQLIRSAESG